jgi:putative transposase
VWSYDFVFDWCANGQKLKCLTVSDEWTKEGLAIEVDGRIRSPRVIEVLSRLVSERGAPRYLRSDNVLHREAAATRRQKISFPQHAAADL